MKFVNKLKYDGEIYRWTGLLNELKQFVDECLGIKGKWTSPGGDVKLFTAIVPNLVIKWKGPRSQKLEIVADNCDHYLEEKLNELTVVNQNKQVSERESSTKNDDLSKPCVCTCKCSGGITVASLEGLKLDVAILESRLDMVSSSGKLITELKSIRSKQQDAEATIRKQEEIIRKISEDNEFFKAKLESLMNVIPVVSHNSYENNTSKKRDNGSGDSTILLDDPLFRDGQNKTYKPASSITDNVPTIASAQHHDGELSNNAPTTSQFGNETASDDVNTNVNTNINKDLFQSQLENYHNKQKERFMRKQQRNCTHGRTLLNSQRSQSNQSQGQTSARSKTTYSRNNLKNHPSFISCRSRGSQYPSKLSRGGTFPFRVNQPRRRNHSTYTAYDQASDWKKYLRYVSQSLNHPHMQPLMEIPTVPPRR